MINEKILLGFPVDFKDICQIYPPTVNDVCGDNDFLICQALFTMTQEELEDAYDKEGIEQTPTPFRYLMINCYQDEEMKEKVIKGLYKLIREPVAIVPEIEMFLIGKYEDDIDPDVDLDEPRLITADNYFDFQNQIRLVMGEKEVEPPEVPDPNEDPRITRWKRKVREHDKIVNKKKHECILKKNGICEFPTEDCSNISGNIIHIEDKITTSDVRVIKWLTGYTVDADFYESPYISEDWVKDKALLLRR